MPTKAYKIHGGTRLKGEIQIRGAKNAVTKEMVAALLASGKTVLENIPNIGDVEVTAEILSSLGCIIDWDRDAGVLQIETNTLSTPTVPAQYSGINRIPILMVGPLLHRFGRAEIPVMGGCKIGSRPIDFHLKGVESLGAQVTYEEDKYIFHANHLKGAHIELPYPSVGATENIMMTAVCAEGTTVISNAAIEPEIVDLALFLQSMGAIIHLDTHRTWVIQGVKKLRPAQHTVIPDRIETASFACAAVATEGDVLIKGAKQEHLVSFLNWLQKAGGQFSVEKEGIRFYGLQKNLKPIACETDVHPGLMTDWQQPLVILLTQARGASVIHETVYENRFGYTHALNKMGAQIQLYDECLGGKPCRFAHSNYKHSCVVMGPTPLKGAEIEIPDLRAGFSYMVAAVLAQGTSILTEVRYIERGYDNILGKFRDLGANISVIEHKGLI